MKVITSNKQNELPTRDRSLAQPAFTLVELLMVMAIMSILLGVGGMSLNRMLQASALTNQGNKITHLVEIARQRAMTANTVTALVMVKSLGVPEDGRAFTILECPPGGTWKQIREWDILPSGIVVDTLAVGLDASFFANSPQPFPFTGGSPEAGAPVDFGDYSKLPPGTYAARIFLPGGGLMNPDNATQFRLVEGSMEGGQMYYSNTRNGGPPVNYYRITLLGTTGKTKVSRP